MGFPLTKDSRFTYHHLVKKEYGGDNSLDNGAVLTREAHALLNYLEFNYYDIYYKINNKLIEINKSKKHPTKEQLYEIKSLIRDYERLKRLEEIEEDIEKNKLLSKKVITL